ncbi:hypothetical protein [Sodalis sp. RH19]
MDPDYILGLILKEAISLSPQHIVVNTAFSATIIAFALQKINF